jgi:hypothetical protein
VVVTTTMVQIIQPATVTTTIPPIATTTSVLGSHSNTISRLCILRNIYSEGISIKEVYPFLI